MGGWTALFYWWRGGILELRVSDLMLTSYPVVDKNSPLPGALEAMGKYGLDRAIVLDSGRLAGVVTKRDILLKLARLRTRLSSIGGLHVSSFMSTEPVTVEASASVLEAARRMLLHGIGCLPVVEGGRLVGLLTRSQVVSYLARGRSDLRVVDVMSKPVAVLKPTDTLLHARRFVEEQDASFLPIVDEEGRLVGYVTVDRLADALIAFYERAPEKHRGARLRSLLVGDIASLRPVVVGPDDPLSRAVEEIVAKGSRGAVVMYEGRLVGVLTLHDVHRYLVVYG